MYALSLFLSNLSKVFRLFLSILCRVILITLGWKIPSREEIESIKGKLTSILMLNQSYEMTFSSSLVATHS